MRDFGLGDGWRLQHPPNREYTFYSLVHHSYSRIDFFLTSNSIIPNISEYRIHPISISDHAPITLIWNPAHLHKYTSRWRLSLLKYPEFDSFLKREWTSFLEINDSSTSGKAVLRGKIILFSVHKKENRKTRRNQTRRKK